MKIDMKDRHVLYPLSGAQYRIQWLYYCIHGRCWEDIAMSKKTGLIRWGNSEFDHRYSNNISDSIS